MRKKKCILRGLQFYLFFFLFSLFWSGPGLCADVTLAWDSNREADLEGYGIFFRKGAPGPPYLLAGYVTLDDLDRPYAPSFTVEGLQEGGRYYFAATAFNTAGKESAYSKWVCADIAADGVVTACASGTSAVSSVGGSGGGGDGRSALRVSGEECFIACAAGGPPGADGSWPLALMAAGGLFCVLSLRERGSGK